MGELLLVFLLAAAVRGLWKQTKEDLARWRGRPARKPGKSLRSRVSASGAGYWGHQAAHGFPTARHGLHDGWMRGREAHHAARRSIAQARAEHAEGLAELDPDLEEFRRRRREALAQREAQRAERDRQALEQWLEREPDPARPAVTHCYEHERLLPCALCREQRRTGSPEPGPEDEHEPDPPEAGQSEYEREAEGIRYGFEFEYCEACGKDLDRHRIAPDALGHAHAYCLDEQETSEEDPPAPAGGEAEGDRPMAQTETTYAGVTARMTSDQGTAEAHQDEANGIIPALEERVNAATQARAWAQATLDQMRALNVDAAVLAAMDDHMAAHAAAIRAEQDLLEKVQAVARCWARCTETAAAVLEQLNASGHGNVNEAHAAAAQGGAEAGFYEAR